MVRVMLQDDGGRETLVAITKHRPLPQQGWMARNNCTGKLRAVRGREAFHSRGLCLLSLPQHKNLPLLRDLLLLSSSSNGQLQEGRSHRYKRRRSCT